MISKIFHVCTCALSKYGTSNCKLAIFLMKPVLATFTVVGPIIWCDNPQVRMWKILYINNNDFHHLGRSQMCAGAWYVFSPSKPHSGTLWSTFSTYHFQAFLSRHQRQDYYCKFPWPFLNIFHAAFSKVPKFDITNFFEYFNVI